jgi:hypothetical protein
LAQWQAGEWKLGDGWALAGAVWSRRVPRLVDLSARFPADPGLARTAYRLSYLAFLEAVGGEPALSLPDFLRAVDDEGGFEGALRRARGTDYLSFCDRFDRKVRRRYTLPLWIVQDAPLWSLLAVAWLVVAVWARLRNRRRLKELDRFDGRTFA